MVWFNGTTSDYSGNGDNVTFDGTAAGGNTSVTLSGTLTPSAR